jgi:hypothetical protein
MSPSRLSILLTLLLVIAGSLSLAQDDRPIDFERARELRQRSVRGETLTKEEQEYLDRARRQMQQREAGQRREVKPPVGLKPLTDMTADEKYKGETGGLYGEGQNEPPAAHREAALEQAKLIRPLNMEGQPDENGKIGLVSIGMSNTTQEFSAFLRLANADREKSPNVVLIDGAQGGMEALAWADPSSIRREEARNPWEVLMARLRQQGVSPEQVQVVWMKQARRSPAQQGEFPQHAKEMQGHMVTILHRLTETFPNLRLVYLSNRIYAGYARSNLNPEPYAYETAFVVRWLIQDQIEGQPALNFDPEKGEVKSPLLLWGPYLWADGENGRKMDDLVWKPEDFAADGTHPSDSGRRKVAQLLLDFMKTDPTAKTWFTR